VSWPRDAFQALRQIVLIEDRVTTLTDTVKELAHTCQELDRRLTRIEAKFELLEHMATPARRALPEKSEK
jgi:predicted RNase H-like nuclease (RuvC/YqgF family)